MSAEGYGDAAYVPSFLYPAMRPQLYRGLGSKAATAEARGTPLSYIYGPSWALSPRAHLRWALWGRRGSGIRRTSLRSYILQCILSYTVDLVPKQQRL
jgi:hypothetical protein